MRHRILNLLQTVLLLGAPMPHHAATGDEPLAVGTFKKWHRLDRVQVQKMFRLADYAAVRIEPFATTGIALPDTDDNTHAPVKKALALFDARFRDAVKEHLETTPVEAAMKPEPAKDAPAPSETQAPPSAPTEPAQASTPSPASSAPAPTTRRFLRVRGQVSKLDPGSQAARYWVGFGAGHARVEIKCEILDDTSGEVLASLTQARVSSGGLFGGGYDALLQKLTEEVGEELGALLKFFR